MDEGTFKTFVIFKVNEMRRLFFASILSLLLSPAAFAEAQLTNTSSVAAQNFIQHIDHFAKNESPDNTFLQRFWIDSRYAKGPDSPVIFRIAGEYNGELLLKYASDLPAKGLNAHVVILEHRYYGKSQPFDDLSTAHLRFLTLENVLEDLVNFQKEISKTYNMNGKWIAVGDSYAGMLAAIYRSTHPELVIGALASSAPMIASYPLKPVPPYNEM